VARWFATGRVPETLAEKRLVVLNLGAMFGMSGPAFGKRLGGTVNQIVEAGDVMFLDEMHGLVGADARESEIEAAALLKGPVLKGELQAIIALGLDRSSESALRQDPWFERCVELVLVHEPTARDTIAILRGLRDRYERHHGVRISDDGIVAAVELADRYIVGRARPSKAIDVIDRASARVRLRADAEAAQPRPEVSAEHVAEVVSREIGIPAETISTRS
jgi:ATP-dependent Clp protease ATP-binding subunit ClpC